MNALVTGATGFIGSAMVDRLLKKGWDVNVYIRDRTKLKKSIRSKCGIFEGDLNDFKKLDKAVRKHEVVFNIAAALPHHKLPDNDYWRANVLGVKNLIKVCLNKKVKRLVHISTVGIYGRPSVYSRTKLEGEKLIFKSIKDDYLLASIIRPTIAYGPGDTRPGFLNLMRLISKGVFTPIGSGENYFHTIYIDNLVDGILLAATNPKAIGEDFIIGDYPVPKMKDILLEMEKVTDKKTFPLHIPVFFVFILAKVFDITEKFHLPSPLNTQRVRFLTEELNFDIQKAKDILGYKPKVSLKQGIGYTYNWYKKRGYL